jgi:hypothetical protein
MGALGAIPAFAEAAAKILKVLYGTDKPVKETSNEVVTRPVSDERLAAAKRLHAGSEG